MGKFEISSETIEIFDKCKLKYYHTDRFKTSVLKLSVALPSDNDLKNTALFSLMINLLKSGTERYPEKSDIIKRLNDLYDANCTVGGYASGDNRIFEISAEMLSDRFSDGESIFDGICELMYQMLFRPFLDGKGHFLKARVERAKKTITDRIKSEKNNSREYAFKKCREIMCEDEPYGQSVRSEIIKRITQKQITDYYKAFVRSLKLEFSYVGDKSALDVAASLKKYFCDAYIPSDCTLIPLSLRSAENVKRVDEELDVKQSVLVFGMRTGVLLNSELACAMCVFNNVYGGTFSSRLFKNIREKKSMCYYVSSDYVTTKALMFVSCAIDARNRSVVEDSIIAELEGLKLEAISDEELDIAKKLAIKEIYDMTDYPNAIASFYFSRSMYGIEMTINEFVDKVHSVSKDDIMSIARGISLDTIFFLKGTGIDNDEEGLYE